MIQFRKQIMSILVTLVLFIIVPAYIFAVPRNLVVVELFTSTTCTGCPGGAMGVQDLITNGHQVAVITHHINDPFQTLSTVSRREYYNNPGTPTAFFDGLDPVAMASFDTSLYPYYLPPVTNRLNTSSNYALAANGQSDGLLYSVLVDIQKTALDSAQNIVLHATVTESAIDYIWFNQTTVESLNRMMVPGHNGTQTTLPALGAGQSVQIPLDFITKIDWSLPDCKLVLWLQDVDTKEILQANQYNLSDFPPYIGNHPPILSLPDSFEFEINSTLREDFSSYASDADADPLVLTCSGNTNIQVDIDGLDVLFSATPDWIGTETLTFTLSDGVESVNQTVDVIVRNVAAPRVGIAQNANSATLSWDAIPNVRTYGIYACETADGTYLLVDQTSQLEWSDPLFTTSFKRFYKVVAYPG